MCLLTTVVAAGELRSRESFDANWRFVRFGPMPDGSQKAEPTGLEQPGVDDGDWRLLNLPHDWGIEGPFHPDLPGSTGKLPYAGIGWYRKPLFLPAADQGKRLFLTFDGAMSHPKIFVNGRFAGEWAYGYNSFQVEITDLVNFNATNVVAVRIDNPPESARWYPGGGIYRNVWLEKMPPLHVAHWGVFVHTPHVDKARAEIAAEITLVNQSAKPARVVVQQRVLAPETRRVLAETRSASSELAPNATNHVTATLTVSNPQLWDVDSPKLHTLQTTVFADGREVDRVETPFGIRRIEWNVTKGFLLNDRIVKLQGACMHHDLGALGAAFNLRAAERQLQILQAMGCNAIRTAHNPPAPQLLDLCDRMGILVVNELFDCWKLGKTPNDYSRDFDAWHERDVVNFVRRDRNHPSVILWSSGNEVKEQSGQPGSLDRSRRLTALFHREDPTRLVTSGMHADQAMRNGFARTVDVAGYNYKAILAKKPNYLDHIRLNPDQPFFGAEAASAVSSRDTYFFPVSNRKGEGFFNFQVSSYDLFAPGWANIPDIDFDSADRLPALAGQFVWTGFDYLGEPTPYNRDISNLLNYQTEPERRAMQAEMDRLGGNLPARSSYFGIIDLAGFPKDRYYLYQSCWRPDLPMAHLLPHWNWPGREGEITPVHLYTTGDEAELFLNGKSLGRAKKAVGQYRLRWNDVKYEPGELKAVVYREGKPWANAIRRTTGKPAKLQLNPDRPKIRADGADLCFITVRMVDAAGDVVPTANHRVNFSVTGPAEIAGVDNGNPISLLSLQGNTMDTFNGLCLVILRTKAGQPGSIELTAQSDGLPAATLRIQSVKE